MTDLLQPKEIELTDQEGVVRTFIISKFPAIAGREIVTKYPVSNIPKLGEYKQSEEIMLKALSFVSVVTENGPLRLSSRALVENHVPDWEILARLEWSILEYNCSFFGKGQNSGSFESLAQKAVAWITQTLTASLQQSSPTTKPPSTN